MSEGLGHNCPHCRELLLPEDFKLIDSSLNTMKLEKQKAIQEQGERELQRLREAASQAFRDSLIPPPIELNLEEEPEAEEVVEEQSAVQEVQQTSNEEIRTPPVNPVVNQTKSVYCIKVSGIAKNRNITKDVLKQVFIPLGTHQILISLLII